MLAEEPLSPVQFTLSQQHVLAVPVEDRAPSGPADCVSHQGPDKVAREPRQDDPDEAQVDVRAGGAHTPCEGPAKEHYRLARNGDAGRPQHH